jgi:hypothetical protein
VSKKTEPTRRQVDALRAQRAHGENVVSWLRARQAKAEKALRALFKKRAKTRPSRGVDRVPAHLDVTGLGTAEWLVVHTEPNHAERHRRSLSSGRSLRAYGPGNPPHTNPARDAKSLKSGALRKELRP